MREHLIDFNEITAKSRRMDEVCEQLKKEFIGIDKQIDQVVNAFRSWYLFPLLQERPVVVNLFGMTGVGKTTLIKRLVKLIDLEPDLVYFNFAAIDEMSGWEVEDNIEQELSNDKSNRIFVYDEFQYAATLNEHGEEKEKKGGLKPFWELLDSGLLHMRGSIWRLHTITTILKYISMIDSKCPIELVNGDWVNRDECLSFFGEYDIRKFGDVLNTSKSSKPSSSVLPTISELKEISLGEAKRQEIDGPTPIENTEKQYNGLLNEHSIGEMYLNYSKMVKDTNEVDFFHKICTMSCDELCSFAYEMRRNLSKGYDLCFKDSIIFVIGNIDEAYTVAFDINPDMSPDQFHKITSDISIVDIKKALKDRFRNEQIARLGNTYVIYPSFDSATFHNIIDLKLGEYADAVMRNVGYKLVFADSLKKRIYDESVYPTHGTRPVFSTIYEMVNTKLPRVLMYMVQEGLEKATDYIEYSFDGDDFVATMRSANGDDLGHINIKEELRLGKLRKPTMGESQASCAVHESGHFVIYSHLFCGIPDKLVSASAESTVGGFLMPAMPQDGSFVESKEMINNRIRVMLGGYVAELICFGENRLSSGAQKDLQDATELAGRMVRNYGMYDGATKSVTSPHTKPDDFMMLEFDSNNRNSIISNIIADNQRYVMNIFGCDEWRNMLKESSQYLSIHTNMPKEEMTRIYENVPEEVRNKRKPIDNFYRKKIDEI